MRLFCRVGIHRYERRHAPGRLDSLGRANAQFDRCRGCGRERDLPVQDATRPLPPFVGG